MMMGMFVVARVALDRGRDLVAVHARHHDVEQDQVGRLLAPTMASASSPLAAVRMT